MTTTRAQLAGIDPNSLPHGEMAKLARHLHVTRERVRQILREPAVVRRPPFSHKLSPLMPPGMALDDLAQQAGLTRRWLSRLVKPGPPVAERTIEKWAPRLAAILGQPAEAVAQKLKRRRA